MTDFEVAGLVLGAIPLLRSALEHYRNRLKFLSAFEVERPRSSARRQNLHDEYGRIVTWLLFTCPNAVDVMERIEKNVLGAEDKNAITFKITFSSSLNTIAAAGAIITSAATTGLLLNETSSAHWTAEAFFMASFIAGATLVFSSHAVQQEINGLHGSEDIRDWLSRPMTQAEARLPNGWLKLTQSLMYSPKSQLQQAPRFAESNSRNRPKRASVYSAVLLTAPAYLFSFAFTAFVVGQGIYLGHVHTTRLKPIFETNGLLVIPIVHIVLMSCITTTTKQLESAPIKRFTRLMNEIPSMVQVHPSSPNEHDTPSVDGAVQTWPTETHNENVIPLSLHESRRRHARLPSNQAHAAAIDSELEETSMLPSEVQADSTTKVRRSSTSALEPSALTPASLQDVPHSHPSADQVPPTNGFRTALERFIRAQEESIDASKALLQSYEINLRPKEYWWS